MLSKLSDLIESMRSFQARFVEEDTERLKRSQYEFREMTEVITNRMMHQLERFSQKMNSDIRKNLEISESALSQIAAISVGREEKVGKTLISVYRQISSEYSHSIKSPLAAIDVAISNLKKILPDLLSGEKPKIELENADAMVSLLENATTAIDCIKEIIRSGAGFLPNEATVFDLETLFRKALRITREATGSRANTKIIMGDIKEVNYFRLNLLITLLQVLENAFEAVPKDGNIKLTASCNQGNEVQILIENDGPPIDRDKYKKLFDEAYSTKGPNRGLGLAVAKKCIEAANGNISLVKSEPIATTFKIIFNEQVT
jgi:signal transduction histidine kinase